MLSHFWVLGIVMLNLLNNMEQFSFKRIIVNDLNENIINFYRLLKSDVKYIINTIKKIEERYNNYDNLLEKEKYYYQIREKFNKRKNKIKAVYFLFLMKAGFNGVYRENSNGKFNVPFGKKDYIYFNDDYLIEVSKLIQSVEFYNLKYTELFDKLKEEKILNKSYIYCDPPYLPEDDNIDQKPLLYTKYFFEHEEFANILNKLKKTKFSVSMIDSKRSDAIYGLKFYRYEIGKLIRTINPKKVFKSTELIFSNYDIK